MATTLRHRFGAWHLLVFGLALIVCGCKKTSPGQSLRNAASVGNAAEVARILARDPGLVDAADPKAGMTPLEFAVISGDQAIATTLLAHGANANTNDKLFMSPLAHAIRKDNWPMVQLLIDHGARIKNVSFMKERATPLMMAAIVGDKSMVEHLLALGADRTARDTEGLTAADHARLNGYKELANLLENPATTQGD